MNLEWNILSKNVPKYASSREIQCIFQKCKVIRIKILSYFYDVEIRHFILYLTLYYKSKCNLYVYGLIVS